MYDFAIARKPGSNFSSGLTTVNLGNPDVNKALIQHRAYCRILKECGLNVTILEPDQEHPDSTFVEDTAILVRGWAILTRPGASSRLGEVEKIRSTLECYFERFEAISAPGTLDGGDICEAENHFFIGVSERTNEMGAHQLADILKRIGFTSNFVDIRNIPGILHLKSGIAYLGEGNLVVIDALANHPAFLENNLIRVQPQENYAANCVLVNDRVLIPAGHPNLAASLIEMGYTLAPLNMREFQKMDGGLSCLSLRF